jgi:hypothetical protein
MNLIEAITKLRDGIEKGDKNSLVEGFFLLTGERLDDTIDKPLRQRVLFPDTEIEPEPEAKPEPVVEPDFKMRPDKAVARGVPVKGNGQNKFDPRQYSDVADEGAGIDDRAAPPTPRDRAPAQTAEVFCQDCKSTVKLSPADARRILAPGSLYSETRKYYCDLVKCGQKCPNQR